MVKMVLLHMLVKMVIGILAIVIQIFRLKVKKGENGKDGTSPYIGPNGNWWINTSDTKIKAQGEKGVNGASAYELWVNDVKNDKIKDKNNSAWSKDKITMADFLHLPQWNKW